MPVFFPTGPVDPESGWRSEEPYYLAREVAKLLHMSPQRVRNNARDGVWPSTPIGRTVYFSRAQIDEIFDRVFFAAARPQLADERRPAGPPRLGVVLSDEEIGDLE